MSFYAKNQNRRFLGSLRRAWLAPLLLAGLMAFPAVAQDSQPLAPNAPNGRLTDQAQEIFARNQEAIFQIRVIDLATDEQAIIGSGFQFTPEGHVASNYHVVAEAVQSPQRYRLECLRPDGTTADLQVLDIDVVHDLSISRLSEPAAVHVPLGSSELAKGARIFSLGNPKDLGMSVVEGTFNGLMEDTVYRKILLAGSLNPGMSGGPSLDRQGAAVGINVSTAGNQISFLVPVERLKELYDRVIGNDSKPAGNWEQRIGEQLSASQEYYFDRLLAEEWPQKHLGEAIIPAGIIKAFKCWGGSGSQEEELVYDYSHMQCSNRDWIFVSPELSSGLFLFKYMWMQAKDITRFRFYNIYGKAYAVPDSYDNAGKKNVTNFECQADFLDVQGRDMRVSLCARRYKKYNDLYDVNLSMAEVDKPDRGLLVEVKALGVSKARWTRFAERFIKAIQWQN